MTPDDILTGAAQALDERGWFRGNFVGPDGGVCLLGAMNVAACGNPHWIPNQYDEHTEHVAHQYGHAHRALVTAIQARPGYLGAGGASVVLFNDMGLKDRDDAKALLAEARAQLAAGCP